MKFRYHNPTVLYFGEEYLTDSLITEILSYGTEVLLVYGRRSVKDNGLHSVVMNILKEANVVVHELSGVMPNAHVEHVRRGVEICRQNRVALVLAIGGGSTIDTAKSIAAGAKYDGDVWDFFTMNCTIHDALPIGTILTTAGTGSEMNPFAVIYNEQSKVKKIVASAHIYPRFSICLPAATINVPIRQVSYGIVDMFTHVLETYLTLPSELIVQKRIDEALLKSIVESGSLVISDPSNVHLRETLMYSSTLALNGMTSMGVQGDWSTHSIVDEIGGFYDVPHGALLSIVLPAFLEHVQEQIVDRLSELGTCVFGIPQNTSRCAGAQECLAAIRRFFELLCSPRCLRELDISELHFDSIAERVVRDGPIGKIKPLGKTDILDILHVCLDGER